MLSIINPATETLITQIPIDLQSSLSQKMDLLKSAQQNWYETGLENRIKTLENFYSLLEQELNNCSEILTLEVGKPIRQSRNEVNGARARIRWMLDNAAKYLCDETMSESGNMKEVLRYEPLGVICNISAWNYPYLVGVNVIVPALLAGNVVMYKPSEFATLTGLKIAELLYKAGVPESVFQVAVGARETGSLLLQMDFNGYYFTGSYATGKYIYEQVAHKMVPCQLELGGKDPLYVADDVADVKAVAEGTADGAFYNNGQSCCSVERIYVHEKVYDEYVKAFVNEVNSYKLGNPMDESVYLGSLTRKAQVEFLEMQVKDATNKGAKLECGGKAVQSAGYFFEPTVLTNVTQKMHLMREESFGPIIGIMKVQNDEEAIQWMNDTHYGLTASVYTSSEARAQKLMSALNAGTTYWNCCDRVSAALPWSGRKNSGFGATLSHLGLRAFTQPKALHLRQP